MSLKESIGEQLERRLDQPPGRDYWNFEQCDDTDADDVGGSSSIDDWMGGFGVGGADSTDGGGDGGGGGGGGGGEAGGRVASDAAVN